MARMTKEKVAEIWDWTNKCYESAFMSIHPGAAKCKYLVSFKLLQNAIRREELYGKPFWDPAEVRQAISREYERLVCQLTTEQLQLIIEAHQKGKIHRAPVTISMITTELFERELRGETQHSAVPKKKKRKTKTKKT